MTNFFYLRKPIILVALLIVITSLSCTDKRASDPCCIFSDVADNKDLAEGQGVILVEGSTDAYFYVLKETGEQLTYQSLNKNVAVEPGKYKIKVNNSIHSVEIRAGEVAKCSTGTLIVAGNTTEYYYVIDTLGSQLAYEALGKSTSWFPGSYTIRVNNTEVPAEVKLKELTEIRTGTVLVKGTTNEYYYVLGDGNKQLNYNALEKPLAFLPGTYEVKVNNTSMKADVLAGKVTELATGNLLVNGLTDEYYYVTDTIGRALNYQALNKPLAFFAGNFHVKVNNTLVKGSVSPGQTTEFLTGSLMLTGGGTGYYYVLDQTGNQLNYNSLNKSLSFFPSEYTIKLGSSTRKATVSSGQLTSISAFN
jgi:6,7-dimethyl-8-ribityllumazine synthase